jgi:uracil-DNA glycosylase
LQKTVAFILSANFSNVESKPAFDIPGLWKTHKSKINGSITIAFVFLPKTLCMDVKMDASWKEVLKNEFTKPYFLEIVTFLKMEKSAGKTIYPPGPLIFNALNQTPFDKVKVVIIGQDPYHNPEQAHGLSFSVPAGIKPPPSLANIYKEIQTDLGIAMPVNYGNLTRWAEQGVLLLNAILTVRANEPASHAKIGWMNFTDSIIQKISDQKKGVVFLLWGKFAQDKQVLIDETKHFILKAAHPSPFSVDKGFYGCKHFSRTNELLIQQGLPPIDWKLLTP